MSNVPAGWYPAPGDEARMRWWDGVQWTDHHADRYTAAQPLKAPEGVKVYNVWIWLITLLPLLSYFSLFLYFGIDWSALFADPTSTTGTLNAEMSLIASPAYIITVLGGWVLYGLLVWFAYLDFKTLRDAGVPRPFHWAWAFLSGVVYVIGRSVVVRRRTGYGIAPMWVSIGIIVFGVILSIVVSAVLVSTIFQNIHTYSPSLGS